MSLHKKLLEDLGVVETPEPQCKGLFFRGSVSRCITSYGGVLERRELRFLKRMSCTGCEKCCWIMEYVSEDIYSLHSDDDFIGNVKHGRLYMPNIVTSRDWESGIDEIDYIEFVEVEE